MICGPWSEMTLSWQPKQAETCLKSSNTGGIDGFDTRDENHPLCKSMVNHDQNTVQTGGGNWKICDHITRDLLKWAEGGGQDRSEPWDSQVGVNLVSLASGTAGDKSGDKGGQTRPPIVMLNQVNSAEITAMAFHLGAVQGAYQILSNWLGNIEMALEVQ